MIIAPDNTPVSAHPTSPEPQDALISNDRLLAEFLPLPMRVYFLKKFPELSEDAVMSRVAELLKFLILVKDFPGNIIFGKEIDEYWHYWIMQTRQYEALCAALPGGSIRHHSSRDYPETADDAARSIADLRAGRTSESNLSGTAPSFQDNAQRILSFFASYRKTFGPVAESVIPLWPPLERLLQRVNWTAEQLEAFLIDQISKGEQKAA